MLNEKKHDPILFGPGTTQRDRDMLIWSSFKSGNKQAFNFIFNTYVKILYAYGDKITREKTIVQDCIQELFIDLWRKRESLNDTDSIKYYLFKSLRRSIVRKITTESRFVKKNTPDEEHPFNVEFSFEHHLIMQELTADRVKLLQQALENLSNRQREAIYLKYYQKLSSQEIADTMNIDINSLYNLISRSIESLREALTASKGLFL